MTLWSQIAIRLATLGDEIQLAQVHIKSWQESYKGLVPQEYLDRLPSEIDKKIGMLALNEENRRKSEIQCNNPLCENVYRFEELESVYSSTHFSHEVPLVIKAQLWVMPSDDMIEALL